MKTKTFAFKALGVVGKLGEGKPVTQAQLDLINAQYSNVPLAATDIYVRPMLLCHSAIDRDGERFHPSQLEVFKSTLPGKGFFAEGHPGGWGGSNGPGKGRIFETEIRQLSPQEFQQLTDEAPQLAPGDTMVPCLFATPYMLRLDSNADTLKNIDAGIQHFVSIGFDAPYREVRDEAGALIYGEYCPTLTEKGEGLEASLVWLGAQPGAGMQKGAKGSEDTTVDSKKEVHKEQAQHISQGGNEPMIKTINSKYGKTFAEGDITGVVAFIDGKDTEITTLKTEVSGMTGAAADGKAYRKHLVDDYIKAAVLLKEIAPDEASQKTETEFLMTVPIDRLKSMSDKALAQAKKDFPSDAIFQGKDDASRDKSKEVSGDPNQAVGEESSVVKDAKKRAEAAGKK